MLMTSLIEMAKDAINIDIINCDESLKMMSLKSKKVRGVGNGLNTII